MITGYIVGQRELTAKFQAAGPKIKAAIDIEVAKLGQALQLRVQRDYLRGPRPVHLGVVHGRLLRSIAQGAGADTRSKFVSTPTSAVAIVGTNVSYGAMWELGFTRKIGAGARGGPRTLSGRALATYIAKHPPGAKQVPGRPFLAPALAGFRAEATTRIEKALREATASALK